MSKSLLSGQKSLENARIFQIRKSCEYECSYYYSFGKFYYTYYCLSTNLNPFRKWHPRRNAIAQNQTNVL